MNEAKKRSKWGIVLQSILVGGLVLGLLFNAVRILLTEFMNPESQFYNVLMVVVPLLMIWFAVGASVRWVGGRHERLHIIHLFAAGIGVSAVGVGMTYAIGRLLLSVTDEFPKLVITEDTFTFFLVLGILTTIVSVIQLRVQWKLLGTIIEIAALAAAVYSFFYFMK